MMKVALVALTLASVAFAQSSASSSTTPTASANAVPSGIPTGASPACQTYLAQLNSDTVINNCLTALIGATDAFDPISGGATVSTVNTTAVRTALDTICAPSFNACPASNIRASLTDFYTHCSTDLLGANGDGSDGNAGVIAIYDVMYLILPLKDAVCTQVDGSYCVSRNLTPTGSSSSAASTPSAAKRDTGLQPSDLFKRTAGANTLLGRADNTTSQDTLGSVAPSADSYRSSGLPYLFLTPNSTDLCSNCTFAIIGAYIRFETVTPYAIGIAHSPMLKGQLDLWNQIKQCPDDFANRLLSNSTGTAATSGAAPRTMPLGVAGLLSIVGAAAAAALL